MKAVNSPNHKITDRLSERRSSKQWRKQQNQSVRFDFLEFFLEPMLSDPYRGVIGKLGDKLKFLRAMET